MSGYEDALAERQKQVEELLSDKRALTKDRADLVLVREKLQDQVVVAQKRAQYETVQREQYEKMLAEARGDLEAERARNTDREGEHVKRLEDLL